MDKFYNVPELLSPAGSEKSVIAAVNAGADAVYFGGKRHNARIAAENIEDSDIGRVIDYCHLRGVRVYITVNTIYKESDLSALLRFIENAYCAGADAFIVQDMGTAALITKFFPDIPMHASTQTTAHSLNDTLFLEENGFSRVVLARELSLAEIAGISGNTESETEVFVHGALCYCYSGRCLLSSFIGGRSGNRGRCAQPCRMFYTLMLDKAPVKTGYLLSPKDLMGLRVLDKIAGAGVSAIKLEGRMKSPEYVYQVTSSYRMGLDGIADGNFTVSPETENDLAQVFNRGGFTEGYFENHSSFSMMSIKSPKSIGVCIGKVLSYDDVLQKCVILSDKPLNPGDGLEIWTKKQPHPGGGVSKRIEPGGKCVINIQGDFEIENGDLVYKTYDKALTDKLTVSSEGDTRKIKIKCYCKAIEGEDFYVRLSYGGLKAEAFGGSVQQSLNRPVTEDKIREQLSKTGGTPFSVEFEECNIGDGIFIGISQINETRRAATATLERKIIEQYKMKAVNAVLPKREKSAAGGSKKLTVSVMTEEQLNAVVASVSEGTAVSRIYAELDIFQVGDLCKSVNLAAGKCADAGVEFFVALPSIQRDIEDSPISLLEKTAINGYLARTAGQLYELRKTQTSKNITADYHFNISNGCALDFYKGYADTASLSVELNFDDIYEFADSNTEIIIYGKQILMTTQQCPVGIYEGNKPTGKYCKLKGKSGGYSLKDKTGVCFPIITNCAVCMAHILNDRPVFMAAKMRDVGNTPVGFTRLSFTDETNGDVSDIIKLFTDGVRDSKSVEKFIEKRGEFNITYGHFYRGSV